MSTDEEKAKLLQERIAADVASRNARGTERPDPKKHGKSTTDLGESSGGGNDEELLMSRIGKLLDLMRERRSTTQVTNYSLETGRPALKPTEDMRGDSSNPYNRLSIEQLSMIKPRAVSNNMANTEDIARLTVAIEGLGVPTEQVQRVVLQAVIYCKDSSSSDFLDPHGTFDFVGGSVMADSILAIFKRDAATTRRVCRLYAPVVWNYMLLHEAPPSDWAAMGFKRTDRFAAFDCFDYVENKAAIQPLEGLIRRPTPNEHIAHQTHKRLALDRSNRNEAFANLQTEITGGKLGPEIARDFKKSINQ